MSLSTDIRQEVLSMLEKMVSQKRKDGKMTNPTAVKERLQSVICCLDDMESPAPDADPALRSAHTFITMALGSSLNSALNLACQLVVLKKRIEGKLE